MSNTPNESQNDSAPVMSNFELKQFGAITELAMNKAAQTDVPFIFLSFAIVFLSTAVLTIAHPETVSFIAGKVTELPANASKIDIYAIFGVTILSLLGAFSYNRHLSFEEIREARKGALAAMRNGGSAGKDGKGKEEAKA